LSCLSVTLVYCGQTDGWIKMLLGTEVCLGPGHIVLDGDPAPHPDTGTTAPPSTFRPFVKRFALRYRTVVCTVCDVCALWPNGLMDHDETWHTGRPQPWPQCVRWGPSSPSTKGAQPPNFWPISVAAKWLHGSRCHLVWS